MNAQHVVTAKLWDLLHPYALLGGLTTLTLFLGHGAMFLSLRTSGEVQARADALARRVAPVAAVLMIAFLAWTAADQSFDAAVVVAAVLAAAAVTLVPLALTRSSALGFAISAVSILLLVAVLLTALYPNALPSTTNHAYDLTLAEAASHQYTLIVMTVVAAIFTPIVLAYQTWTYWVFRHRLGRDDFGVPPTQPFTPVSVLEQRANRRAGNQPPPAKPSTGPATGA